MMGAEEDEVPAEDPVAELEDEPSAEELAGGVPEEDEVPSEEVPEEGFYEDEIPAEVPAEEGEFGEEEPEAEEPTSMKKKKRGRTEEEEKNYKDYRQIKQNIE